ncbi:dihydrodipicolinate synthase family protein [Ramlibacter tataouinensis]|uniref:dihydrodipicolinate synthase family protein n=1 Tax=Ramlibacter tataouinensis TaxID=94132 RepID=UPI0022F3E533|nr:dihydrodipicolinate synthase family protein [Ramlibacter tataouinensis]WBY03958.1 dihydrodipicolinate synthase family protein [Ramlibacter tataouinensis]
MTTSKQDLSGVLSPVLTPFNADYSPDPDRLIRHCRWLLEQEVGLAVFGTNSEANSLALAEKRRLLDALLEAGLPASRMMPGTGCCALPETIELTRAAVAAGCAGVLMLPPFFYKNVSEEGLYRAFSTVIEAVADERLRLYLYHIPPVSQVPITHGLVARLLDRYPGCVAGMKDSSGDWNNTRSMIEAFGPRGFQVFAGSETYLLATMEAGGAGCITATGNVNPGPILDLYKSWQAPDAQQQQDRLDATRAAFAKFPMIPAMKAAIAWKSGRRDWLTVRPPLVDLSPAEEAELHQRLDAVRFELPRAEQLA